MNSHWVRYQRDPWKAPDVIRLSDLPAALVRDRYSALSMQAWSTEEEAQAGITDAAARYLPIWDFDGPNAPVDCEAYCAQQLEAWGLRRGRDYLVCVSSPGSRKVFLARWLPAAVGWPLAWEAHQKKMKAWYPTMDAQMPRKGLARWVGSEHRGSSTMWQVPVVLGASDNVCLIPPSKSVLGWAPGLASKIPAWAARVLDSWEFDAIVKLSPKRRQESKRWRDVNYSAALDSAKVTFKVIAKVGGDWLRLRTCPFCSKRWKAAVSPNGWLSCYSPKCAAHAGVSPHDKTNGWAAIMGIDPNRLAVKQGRIVRAKRVPTQPMPLKAARRKIERVVRDAVDGARPVVLRVTPGTGKSTTTLREIARRATAGDTRFLYLCPTRELAHEKAAELRARGARPAVLAARTMSNCALISKVRAASEVGYAAGTAICPSCPYQAGCQYFTQLDRASSAAITVTVWEHLALVDSGRLRPHHIVIDEFPERAMIKDDIVTMADLEKWSDHNEIGRAATALMSAALAVRKKSGARKDRVAWRGGDLRKIARYAGGGIQAAVSAALLPSVEALQYAPGSLAAMDTSQIEAAPPLRVPELIIAMDAELRTHGAIASGVSLIWTKEGMLYQNARLAETESYSKVRLVLDGYGRAEMYERMLGGDVDLERVDAEFCARTWQIPENTSRSAFKRNGEKLLALGVRAVKALRAIGHTNILVLTYQFLRETVESWGVDVRHFGQGVGVNTYRHTHTAVLVFGTPRRPHDQMVALASALHAGEDAVSEAKHPATSQNYDDPRLQAVLEVAREDEVAQGVHRIGPVIPGPTQKDVVVMGKVEIGELPPPDVVGVDSLDMAAKIMGWALKYGWWANFMRELLAPGVISTDRGTVRKAQRRYDEALKLGVASLQLEGRGVLQHDGKEYPMGFIWGDVDAAKKWATDFLSSETITTWDMREARRRGVSVGLGV